MNKSEQLKHELEVATLPRPEVHVDTGPMDGRKYAHWIHCANQYDISSVLRRRDYWYPADHEVATYLSQGSKRA